MYPIVFDLRERVDFVCLLLVLYNFVNKDFVICSPSLLWVLTLNLLFIPLGVPTDGSNDGTLSKLRCLVSYSIRGTWKTQFLCQLSGPCGSVDFRSPVWGPFHSRRVFHLTGEGGIYYSHSSWPRIYPGYYHGEGWSVLNR